VSLAAQALDFEIGAAAVESVTEGRRRLRWPLEAQHALVPCDTGEIIRDPAGFHGLLRRMPDGRAIDAFPRLRAHTSSKRRRHRLAITPPIEIGTGDRHRRQRVWKRRSFKSHYSAAARVL
jgi:hypothetical protein